MVWIYLSIIIIIIILLVIYKAMGLKVIRVFGCELITILVCSLFLILLIGEVILPMPQYYIKHQTNNKVIDTEFSLNKILEEEAKKSGINFDKGSFKILDSHGMSFNHIFLCAYKSGGKEEVRIFHLEKNIFGNMKPKYPLNEAYIIPKVSSDGSFYRTYVKDGFLGGYMITAGYASEETVLENYKLNNFMMEEIHPSSYFMWVELVDEPWKSELIKIILLFILISVSNRNRKPTKFYTGWQKGDPVFSVSWGRSNFVTTKT